MKNLVLFLLAIFTIISINSCSRDEENSKIEQSDKNVKYQEAKRKYEEARRKYEYYSKKVRDISEKINKNPHLEGVLREQLMEAMHNRDEAFREMQRCEREMERYK